MHWVDVPLPGPRLPHDMAFTENYAILNDCPLFWDAELLAQGRARAHASAPTCRRGSRSIPRRGATADIRWFEADPTYVLHWANAYEDGDEIVLDGFFQGDPMPAADGETDPLPARVPRHRHAPDADACCTRWRMNLATGDVQGRDAVGPDHGVPDDQPAASRAARTGTRTT